MLSVRLPLLAFVFVAASAANAVVPQQPCTSDDECGPDEICALSDCGAPCDPDDAACEPTDCGSEGGTCIAIDTPPEPTECLDSTECAAGQYCLLADCGPTCDPDEANCEPTDCSAIGRCVEEEAPVVECATDSDCAGEDICIIEQRESCSGGSSDPGEPGSDRAPPRDPPSACTSVTFAVCAPRYLASCAVDSDCGAGFTCELDNQVNCACTAPDGDPSTDECVCDDAIATEGYCELIPVACTDDADCDNGFVCLENGDVSIGCSEAGDDGDSNCGAEAAPPDVSEEGFCAPVDFNGPRGGETGETPTVDETDEEDIVGIDDDDGYGLHCASTSANPAGLLPFAALALVLRRRRA